MTENARQITLNRYALAVPLPFEQLPDLLKFLRNERGETLKEAGNALGVPFQTLGGYEKGTSSPPLAALGPLLAHLGVHTYGDLQRAQDRMTGVGTERSNGRADVASAKEARLEQSLDLALETIAELRKVLSESKRP